MGPIGVDRIQRLCFLPKTRLSPFSIRNVAAGKLGRIAPLPHLRESISVGSDLIFKSFA